MCIRDSIQKIVAEVAKELEEEKLPYTIPEQGIMIETPAAVMMSEELAEHVAVSYTHLDVYKRQVV